MASAPAGPAPVAPIGRGSVPGPSLFASTLGGTSPNPNSFGISVKTISASGIDSFITIRTKGSASNVIKLPRQHIAGSAKLSLLCASENPNVGHDVLLEGHIYNHLNLEFIGKVLNGQLTAKEALHHYVTNYAADMWQFILAGDHLEIESILVEARNYVTDQLHKSPSDVRATFKVNADFEGEELDRVTQEESEFKRLVKAKWTDDGSEDELMSISQIWEQRSTQETQRREKEKEKEKEAAEKLPAARLSIDQEVRPRQLRDWQADSSATHCSACKKPFPNTWMQLTSGRHHCRLCGLIYCEDCCSKWIQLPSDDTLPQDPSYLRWAMNETMKRVSTNPVQARICKLCDAELGGSSHHQVYDICNALFALAIEPLTLRCAGLICSSWRKAAILCLSKIREIQYRLPTHTLSLQERRYLLVNCDLWAGHSGWTVQLMRACDWDNHTEAEDMLKRLQLSKKLLKCSHLLCSRECSRQIGYGASLVFLSDSFRNAEIRDFAVGRLSECPNKQLLCFLPLLVHYIRYEDVLIDTSPLITFLVAKAVEDVSIRVYLFFTLKVWAKTNHPLAEQLYDAVRNKLLISLPAEAAQQLLDLLTFVSLFESFPVASKNTDLRDGVAKKMDALLKAGKLPLITNPEFTIQSIDFKKIEVMKSTAAPIMVPCVCIDSTGTAYDLKLMYKKDDIRKDFLILSLLRLMASSLINHPDKPFLPDDVVVYNVLPTRTGAGFIEIVLNSRTFYDIEQKEKRLRDWIDNRNQKSSIEGVRGRFARSTAAYSAMMYLLGVGDRHRHNLMIRQDGAFFNIDYGFIFGQEPDKLMQTIMPVLPFDNTMIDAMGGPSSDSFNHTFKFCLKEAYVLLRRNVSLIVSMLTLFADVDPSLCNPPITMEMIDSKVMERFRSSLNPQEARKEIMQVLERCTDSSGKSLKDWIHWANQEFFSSGLQTVQGFLSWNTPTE